MREGVQVKRLATKEDVYVLAQSDNRIGKERGMRRKRLRRYVDRLQAQLQFYPTSAQLEGLLMHDDATLPRIG